MLAFLFSQLNLFIGFTVMKNYQDSLIQQDLKFLWHPCSQMKDYENFEPLVVTGAEGSYIKLHNDKKIIDAISSWWCKSLGHQHPQLKKALFNQIEKFEHVILANTTNTNIVKLSEKLTKLTSTLGKVYYAGDGSSAVEIALKMSLHSRQILGETKKIKFIALENSYHGETTGALSVSDMGIYRNPYRPMLFDTYFISPIPYVTGTEDPLWSNCSDYWNIIEKNLIPYIDITTALIIDPIVQGAGGMKIYSQDFLKRLRIWTKKHNIHLIADEIMTGIGRTGKMLACEHADIEPDFLCLSKGLTSGWLPLSAVLIRDDIYQIFYDNYETGKTFFHSHTYSGNALAASVALAVLKLFEDNQYENQANIIGNIMFKFMQEIADHTHKLKNIRSIGAIVAADLICEDNNRRIGYEIYQKATELGALLRPLGNTIYWLPPLNISMETLYELKVITEKAILAVKF